MYSAKHETHIKSLKCTAHLSVQQFFSFSAKLMVSRWKSSIKFVPPVATQYRWNDPVVKTSVFPFPLLNVVAFNSVISIGGFHSHRGTPSHHPFRTMGFSLTKTIQLWGSPHFRLHISHFWTNPATIHHRWLFSGCTLRCVLPSCAQWSAKTRARQPGGGEKTMCLMMVLQNPLHIYSLQGFAENVYHILPHLPQKLSTLNKLNKCRGRMVLYMDHLCWQLSLIVLGGQLLVVGKPMCAPTDVVFQVPTPAPGAPAEVLWLCLLYGCSAEFQRMGLPHPRYGGAHSWPKISCLCMSMHVDVSRVSRR